MMEVECEDKIQQQDKYKFRKRGNRQRRLPVLVESSDLLECAHCGKTFKSKSVISVHIHKVHLKKKKYSCSECDRSFTCERSLLRHKEAFPLKHYFPCGACSQVFYRFLQAIKHFELKHPDVKDTLQQQCEQLLSEVDPSIKHFCSNCDEIFYTTTGLQIHKNAIHPGHESFQNEREIEDITYQCDICLKNFVSLEGFEFHKKNGHVSKSDRKKIKNNDQKQKFTCKICSAEYDLKVQLQTHLKTHNVTKNVALKTGRHECCVCPRSFSSSDGLKYHLATHTGERIYSCETCKKKFIKKTHLLEHIATHSEKYFKCQKCPRKFSTHSAYKKHLKHFPGPHCFPCIKCGKLFMKESMLEKHICMDLGKITLAPEVKALLSEDMIEELLCLVEEQDQDQNQKFSCYKCFKVFPNLNSLQGHQSEHVGKQGYQCRFCKEHFKRADLFVAHISDHFGGAPYMCLKCNRKFFSPTTLSLHYKVYPGDHSFTCTKCNRWFPSEKRLERHECLLQNCDSFLCACGERYRSWNELLAHAGAKPFQCCRCELKFTTLMGLARHIKKHTGVRPFVCDICGRTFRTKSNYLNHKMRHAQTEEFKCNLCDHVAKSQKRLDSHLFSRHEVPSDSTKSSLCPRCGLIFPFTSQLRKHLETEHKSDLPLLLDDEDRKSLPTELCTLCGKILVNKYTLANHMRNVHDPNMKKKEVKELVCEVCDEKFPTTKKLNRHKETHETPGLRVCEICCKEFYFAKDLRKHLRKHDTNKPFSCPTCGKFFKVAVSLKYHATICSKQLEKVKEEEPPTLSTVEFFDSADTLNNKLFSVQLFRR